MNAAEKESLQEVSREINSRLAPIFESFAKAQMERERDAAKANPLKHKLSTVMEAGQLSSRHWGVLRDGRGRRVKFCWSCHRNVAGFFLAWREVETPVRRKGKPKPGDVLSTIVRDQWTARRTKKALEQLQKRRHDAMLAKRPKPEPKTFWVSLRRDAASRGLGQVRAADEAKAAEKARVKWGDRETDGWRLNLIRFAR